MWRSKSTSFTYFFCQSDFRRCPQSKLSLAKNMKPHTPGCTLVELLAAMAAQRQVENLRSYAALESTPAALAYADFANGAEAVAGKTGSFQRAWRVAFNIAPECKQFDLNVNWPDVQSNIQVIAATTEIARIHPAATAVSILPSRNSPAGLPAR